MAELYRPSNGTEGEGFMSRWCGRCERDAAFRRDPDRHDGCRIAADAMAYDVTDPEYPREWIRTESGPRCTAFVAEKSDG